MTDKIEPKVAKQDTECADRIRAAMKEQNLDAFLCALPSQVLLLTGFWPVMGSTVAVLTKEGEAHLVVPHDESEQAKEMSVARRHPYAPASLSEIVTVRSGIVNVLEGVIRAAGLHRARIGVEAQGETQPSSYLSQYLFGDSLQEVVRTGFPEAILVPADATFKQLKGVLSAQQLGRLRNACEIAKRGFEAGQRSIQLGRSEGAVADAFRHEFTEGGLYYAVRSDAHLFCMSGHNSAEGNAAFAKTRRRVLEGGDLAMIHCNSYADGLWTDITRTYTCGEPDDRQNKMYQAIAEARSAAIAKVAPGVAAADVDKAARRVLESHGFGREFTHATGHGVGFSAADHDAIPRIHPASTDVLETGMTFNIEPAIYIGGYGGMRHCDVVTVGKGDAEVLTDF